MAFYAEYTALERGGKKRHLNINKSAESRGMNSQWKVCSLGRRIYAPCLLDMHCENADAKSSDILSEFIEGLPLNCKVLGGSCFQLTFVL